MKRKGITPVIAIIILLLITVSLAGTAWVFLQGFVFPAINKAFTVPQGGAYCTNGLVNVFVTNTGIQSDILTPDDWVVATLSTNDMTHDLGPDGEDVLQPVRIEIGETKHLIQNYDCAAGGCGSGQKLLTLGTSSGVQHIGVFCP